VRDGDRLRLDDGVEIRVLHPPFGRPHSDDNANSIVLSIEFAGRRILLTGDLEGHGQTTLLSTPPVAVDVLQSPHHGSRRANSAALGDWANPKEVVISADARVDFKSLRAAYDPETRITSTDDAGAITFEIHPDGTLERTTYVAEKHVR
jgi:competence protein ComEC